VSRDPRRPLDPRVPATIVCVDCGGRAHLLTILDDEPVEPGDVIAYRCEDCNDRWDIVIPDDAGD
jgi:hypothetical protein